MEYIDALEEANKCLNCKNPMCQKGCPVQTNIPLFISKIKENKLEEAYNILNENNIMSYICSTVCPYEEYCMGSCIKGIKGESVKISTLEKYVNSWARDNNITYDFKLKENNGIKIAIIGSGPSSIACAVELKKEGYDVYIFEKEEFVGGLLTYGIPGFRLPRNITKILEDNLKKINIKINTNIEFGKDITISSLKENGFKAIFIGIGNEIAASYKLTDKKCTGIYSSDHILREYNAKNIVPNLGKVIVIGGGNVAIDSARAAIRMNTNDVTIVYRRSHEKMPARDIELNEALNDGAKIIYNTKVLSADVENEKIRSINCIKTEEINGTLTEVNNSKFSMDANSIIFAIGLKPNDHILKQEGIDLIGNLIKVDENNKTNIDGVFAGGDVMQNKATVCMAIKEGKKAAKSIIKYVQA